MGASGGGSRNRGKVGAGGEMMTCIFPNGEEREMAGLEEAQGLRSGLYVPDADGEVFVTRGHPRTVRERAQAVDRTGARLESQHASANLDVPRSE